MDKLISEPLAWIGEVKSIATKTVLVTATTRKEAQHKLRHAIDYIDDIEGIHVTYQLLGPGKIIRRDGRHAG